VAWLSTSSSPAASRLGGARGWVRVDGRPFADRLDAGIAKVFYPLALDENGSEVSESTVWTGTRGDGSLTDTCSDWQSATGQALVGFTSGGTWVWTDSLGALSCSGTARFYCLGTDRSAPLPPIVPPSLRRLAFLSNTPWNPSGGVVSADALCQASAPAGPPGNIYRALLATPVASATSRVSLFGAPWVRPDGVIVTAIAADLAMARLQAPIEVSGDGQTNFVSRAWTGSVSPTAALASTCSGWSSSSGMGSTGLVNRASPAFFFDSLQGCSLPIGRIYCLQE
jgi:hypothetical protein